MRAWVRQRNALRKAKNVFWIVFLFDSALLRQIFLIRFRPVRQVQIRIVDVGKAWKVRTHGRVKFPDGFDRKGAPRVRGPLREVLETVLRGAPVWKGGRRPPELGGGLSLPGLDIVPLGPAEGAVALKRFKFLFHSEERFDRAPAEIEREHA